mgnify:CR=1 FL=1
MPAGFRACGCHDDGAMLLHWLVSPWCRFIDQVRKRKGLAVERKLVMHAEKQRTLSRKK